MWIAGLIITRLVTFSSPLFSPLHLFHFLILPLVVLVLLYLVLELQTALFNGAGFVSWENVWGYWNGLTDFDAESLRRSAAILRFFSEPFFHSPDWLPYFPTLHHTIVASYWPSVNSSDVLWVFVNYGGVDFSGPVLNVTSEFLPDTNVSFYQFFDVYHGEPITPLSINNSSARQVPSLLCSDYSCSCSSFPFFSLSFFFSLLLTFTLPTSLLSFLPSLLVSLLI